MRQAASLLLWLPATVTALTVAEINGDTFLSPYKGAAVTNVTGLVTAKGSFGVFIRSTTPDDNDSTSESILVYSSSVASSLTVGDIVTLDGTVSEYRSSDAYLYLTEITRPSNVKVVSSGNEVTPVVIGEDTPNPVTVQYTSLDEGDIFSLPNARSNVSSKNPTLDPSKYGLDFWESLMGELVTIKNPRALSRPNTYGDTWVVSSDWETSGQNEHGGLTITDQDENPEAILIGSPLDNSANPDGTKMGDLLEDITGVIYQAFGFYRILPLTGLTIKTPSEANAGPTTLLSSGDCSEITVADYNVENLSPSSAHLPRVAAHIVNYLKTPDLIFVQEIQDNSGPTNNGVVSANETLLALTSAISSISNVSYSFIDIDPVDGQDGGQPGGNIRVAYLYNPKTIKLAGGLTQGGSTDANGVIADAEGKPTLKYNPGRIDPTNAAWLNSRKPLAAAWVPANGNTTFFTVNVHWASKGGSSSIHGDYRPPINGAVEQRVQMANVTGTFINSILALDSSARIIAAGDFNEFSVVEPILALEEATGMQDLDEVVGRDVVERYTYQFDMNTQALDHMLVSPALQTKKTALGYEHLHVNSWATANDVVSDHDPSVAKFNLCDCE